MTLEPLAVELQTVPGTFSDPQSAIQAIDNLEKLEQLTERLLTASSWHELLRDV